MSAQERRTFSILGFKSTHDALDAEALLDDLGFDVVPIPAPASLTANCGIALRVEFGDAERALNYLERAGIEVPTRGEIDDV